MVEARKTVFGRWMCLGLQEKEGQISSLAFDENWRFTTIYRIHGRVNNRTGDTIKKKKEKKRKMYGRSDERHFRYVRNDAKSSRRSYTHEGGTTKGEEGRDRGIQKHTAHSDTMLLRKRKRGRAGGSAGQYRGPRRTARRGRAHRPQPTPPDYTKKTY